MSDNPRYVVQDGSESGHCCFEYTIIDSKTPCPVFGLSGYNKTMCECFTKEAADTIVNALNKEDCHAQS